MPIEAKNWTEEEFKEWLLSKKFQFITIACWMLSEAIAILGNNSLFTNGNKETGLALIAVSLVLGFLHRPDINRFKENLKKQRSSLA